MPDPAAPPRALVLYARVPRRGEVKTRMRARLTEAGVLRLHLALLEDSAALLRAGAALAGARPYLAFSEPWRPRRGTSLERALAGVDRLPQRGGDLGERLRGTFRRLLGAGCRSVVVFGCDSPALPPRRLRQAFERLEAGADLVLAPARDGGYLLIGLRGERAGACGRRTGGRTPSRGAPRALFEGIPWGTASVLRATLEAARRTGMRRSLLPPGDDVDRPADLDRLRRDLGRLPRSVAPRTRAFLQALDRGPAPAPVSPPRSSPAGPTSAAPGVRGAAPKGRAGAAGPRRR